MKTQLKSFHILYMYYNTGYTFFINTRFEPTHEIMVLITQATSEGSGEPAHPRRLARAFAVRTHEVC